MTILRTTAVIAMSLLFGSLISAAETTPPLTGESVERFLESMKDVEKLSEKYRAPDKSSSVDAAPSMLKGGSIMGGGMGGGVFSPGSQQIPKTIGRFYIL